MVHLCNENIFYIEINVIGVDHTDFDLFHVVPASMCQNEQKFQVLVAHEGQIRRSGVVQSNSIVLSTSKSLLESLDHKKCAFPTVCALMGSGEQHL